MKKYQVDVPEGRCGDWEIKRFTVSEEEAALENVRIRRDTNRLDAARREIDPGDYTKLIHHVHPEFSGIPPEELNGPFYVMMSDTPAEIRDHVAAIETAEGNVLIGGLGLGMVAKAICDRIGDGAGSVHSVTIVEKEADVIQLVEGWLRSKLTDEQNNMLAVIPGDVYDAETITKESKLLIPDLKLHDKCCHMVWDHAWFDIWPDISSKNLHDFNKLAKSYTETTMFVGFWAIEECIKIATREAETAIGALWMATKKGHAEMQAKARKILIDDYLMSADQIETALSLVTPEVMNKIAMDAIEQEIARVGGVGIHVIVARDDDSEASS